MDFLEKAKTLHEEGQPFVLATVVRVEKPTSARPGAKAIITEDGNLTGWIGGSCAEPSVKREAAKALQDGSPRLMRLCPPDRLGMNPQEGIVELKLTCMSGGTLDIYLEPYLPPPHLLVIGHLPIAESLATLAKALEYSVTVMGEVSKERFPAADRVMAGLDFARAEITPNTFVVIASHGNYDEPALEAILPSQAPYVALVASKKRAGSVRDYLRQAGLAEELIARLKYPAGLDIGAATPQEIALSILAEIVQQRHHKTLPNAGEKAPVAAVPETAIDPVCGMTVDIATARYTSVHDDQTYYFCAARCQQRFERDPQKYLQPETSR